MTCSRFSFIFKFNLFYFFILLPKDRCKSSIETQYSWTEESQYRGQGNYNHWKVGGKSQIGESLLGKSQTPYKPSPNLLLTPELYMYGAYCKNPVKKTELKFSLLPKIHSFQFESNQVNCLLQQKYQHYSEEHSRIQSFHTVMYTMSRVQGKIIQCMSNQENVICFQNIKNKETNPRMTWVSKFRNIL